MPLVADTRLRRLLLQDISDVVKHSPALRPEPPVPPPAKSPVFGKPLDIGDDGFLIGFFLGFLTMLCVAVAGLAIFWRPAAAAPAAAAAPPTAQSDAEPAK